MNTEISRRSLFAGMGAAITLAALPALPVKVLTPQLKRALPVISSRLALQWPLTRAYLIEFIRDLWRQVAALEVFQPMAEERETMAVQIDDAFDQIRPPGLQILVQTPIDKILLGEFDIREEAFGRVVIS